ncbi:hypothetical protein BGZ63DRAFT_391904 [Mariannaea sp. PMI_226]|nr:hypothetical protein BGZ63DRAFT_391904 [Mariannaea sp. PMI_226]
MTRQFLTVVFLLCSVILWVQTRPDGIFVTKSDNRYLHTTAKGAATFCIWIINDARLRREYARDVNVIAEKNLKRVNKQSTKHNLKMRRMRKGRPTTKTELLLAKKCAERACRERNELAQAVRLKTSPFGLKIAVQHKRTMADVEKLTDKLACQRYGANGRNFAALDPVQKIEVYKDVIHSTTRHNSSFTKWLYCGEKLSIVLIICLVLLSVKFILVAEKWQAELVREVVTWSWALLCPNAISCSQAIGDPFEVRGGIANSFMGVFLFESLQSIWLSMHNGVPTASLKNETHW